MLGKPIFIILDNLSQKGIDRFQNLLNSGFLKQSEQANLLFQIILDTKDDNKLEYSKEQIHKIIYAKDKYKDDRLRLLYSDLLKTLETYISLEETLSSTKQLTKNQLSFYKKNQLTKLYESKLKKYHTALTNDTLRNSEYQKEILEYELEQYDLLSAHKRNQELNLQKIHNRIDEAYYAQKLRWACLALSHQAVYQTDYDIKHIDMIISESERLDKDNIPTIDVYAACYLMIKLDSKDSFSIFRARLDQYHSRFDPLELRELYLLGINFCIRHLNRGEKDFGKVGIGLYQIALQRKLLMNDGLLSRYTYRNIAMMAIRVEDFDWAASFSEEYKPYLDKKHQDSSYYFNLALIYYNRGQLDESLDAMIHVDFKDPLIHLAAKTLQLKLYYELGEWSLLDSHLDTMQMYLIRKKILGYHKQNYKNIIKYTRNIIGLAEFDTDKKAKLITQITDAKPLTERKWLLAQLG